ncbi:MAG: IS1595 family transposase [Dehalococcoidia bacterium]
MKAFTFKEFNRRFPTDDACLDFLKETRWPKGVFCPKCQKTTKHYRIASRKVYSCEFCGNHVSPTADTIFHKSDTSLRSWFYAMYLMASTRCGISAKQLQRELGVTYKTAWRMFTQIRKLMSEDCGPLFGQVEVDETYIGGKRHGKRGRGAEGKTIVMGMAQRNGKAIANVVPDVKAKTLVPMLVNQAPVTGITTIFTDELGSYNRLAGMGYDHERVYHSALQYVNGTAHVNNVECLWSHIKRGINGVYHSVGPQHLQSYLDEYVFRYNHRSDETPMFSLLLERIPSCGSAERPS